MSMHVSQSSAQCRFSIHDKHCLNFIFIMEIKIAKSTQDNIEEEDKIGELCQTLKLFIKVHEIT